MKNNSSKDKPTNEIFDIKEAIIDLIYDIKSTQKSDVIILFNNYNRLMYSMKKPLKKKNITYWLTLQ